MPQWRVSEWGVPLHRPPRKRCPLGRGTVYAVFFPTRPHSWLAPKHCVIVSRVPGRDDVADVCYTQVAPDCHPGDCNELCCDCAWAPNPPPVHSFSAFLPHLCLCNFSLSFLIIQWMLLPWASESWAIWAYYYCHRCRHHHCHHYVWLCFRPNPRPAGGSLSLEAAQ